MAVSQKISEGPWLDAPPLATYVDNIVLAATTAETVTIPATADIVLMSYSVPPFYVRKGGTATVPAADIVDGTGMSVSPTYRRVDRGGTFSVIAPSAGVLSLEWFSR